MTTTSDTSHFTGSVHLRRHPLAAFAEAYSLQFTHPGPIAAKRGCIVVGNVTKDRNLCAVMGLMVDSKGCLSFDKEERRIALPNRTIKSLTDAGCEYSVDSFFTRHSSSARDPYYKRNSIQSAVIEFDWTDTKQAEWIIRHLGIPKQRQAPTNHISANATAGLEAYRQARREAKLALSAKNGR